MKQVIKGLIALALIASLTAYGCCNYNNNCCNTNCCNTSCCDTSCCNTCCDTTSCDPCCNSNCGCCCNPFLAYRSQSVNLARWQVGWQKYIHQYRDDEKMYGAFYVAPEYTRSFKGCKMAQYLFCNDCLKIQGSQVENRDANAWLADYFGLPTDYKSKVSFKPRIQNFLVDLGLYLGLDNVTEGLYFKLYSPITYTRWELCPCETIEDKGTNKYSIRLNSDPDVSNLYKDGFDAGYMSNQDIAREDLPSNFLAYMGGGKTFGDLKDGLMYGRIANCKLTRTRLADIHAELGWNFLQDCKDYRFGLGIHAAAPTGNRPCATYVFEPMVGNGKHWELGLSATAYTNLWRCKDDPDKEFNMYFDAIVTHLFKSCQRRSFDFYDNPCSRYMLLEEMEKNGENELETQGRGADDIPANYRYAGNLVTAINLTTMNVDVKIDIQADLAIKFGYITKCWTWDIGYNLWARTGEKFYNKCCDWEKKYALKGDSFLYGRMASRPDIHPLSGTQSEATIYGGKNFPKKTDERTIDPYRNLRVDNPWTTTSGLAWGDIRLSVLADPQFAAGPPDEDRYQTGSIQPKLISMADVNFCKTPSALSHKIFTHFSYAWDKEENECGKTWSPFLGIGGEVEFDGKGKSDKSAVNQWGIWLKGGFSFN